MNETSQTRRAARRRVRRTRAALRLEEARLAEQTSAAEHLAELEASAIMHARWGMPGSAAQFRRMADEYRLQRPDVAARVIVPPTTSETM